MKLDKYLNERVMISDKQYKDILLTIYEFQKDISILDDWQTAETIIKVNKNLNDLKNIIKDILRMRR